MAMIVQVESTPVAGMPINSPTCVPDWTTRGDIIIDGESQFDIGLQIGERLGEDGQVRLHLVDPLAIHDVDRVPVDDRGQHLVQRVQFVGGDGVLSTCR
jgi:hypothetical protein